MPENNVGTPGAGRRSERSWHKAREPLPSATTRSRRRALRRRVPVEKEYEFDTEEGKKSLAELFDGRSQLLAYKSCTGPTTRLWGGPGCRRRVRWGAAIVVAEAGAAGAGPDLVVRPVHDVVMCEQLRAAVEELGAAISCPSCVSNSYSFSTLYLGQRPAHVLDLVVALGLLGLELRELRSRRLPLLAGSNVVLRHLGSFLSWYIRRDSVQTGN